MGLANSLIMEMVQAGCLRKRRPAAGPAQASGDGVGGVKMDKDGIVSHSNVKTIGRLTV